MTAEHLAVQAADGPAPAGAQDADDVVAAPPVVEAAGVVCWRRPRGARGTDGLELLLVHSGWHGTYGLPKGKREPGEPLPVCAVRETAEETGARVVLGRPLPTVGWTLPDGRPKVAHYWVARAVGEGPRTATPEEIDDVRWVGVEEARALLPHAEEHLLVDQVTRWAEEGTLDTTPVLVLRHAKARPRASWSRADADRPLVEVGRKQAEALVPLLSCWRPTYVVTSPWQRCRQTVAPFLRATKRSARAKGGLSEDGSRRHPNKAGRHLAALLDGSDASLLCTHRPVLPRLLGTLEDACTPDARAQLPQRDPFLEPSQVLVAHVGRRPKGRSTGVVVAVEVHSAR